MSDIQREPRRSFGFDHLSEFKNFKNDDSSSDDDNTNVSEGSKKFDTSTW